MKTLRYLLSVIAVVSVLGVSAQTLAQNPEIQMHSTSGMIYSGSKLPQAAQSGAMLTGSTIGSYTPASVTAPNSGKAHRAKMGDDDWEDDDWGETGDPWATPIGDAMWPMIMLALAYAIYKVSRMRRREEGMLKR